MGDKKPAEQPGDAAPAVKSDLQLHADAVLAHAQAINNLASAITAHAAVSILPPLSRADKIAALGKLFRVSIPVTAATLLSDCINNFPTALGAWFPLIESIPSFAARNLVVHDQPALISTNLGQLADAVS